MSRKILNWPTKSCTRVIGNYRSSHGSTLVDIGGKSYLDMFGSISSLPVGYNHPKMVELARKVDPNVLIHKPATGFFPPDYYPELLNNVVKKSGLKHTSFYTMATGSEAVENAIKLAYLKRSRYAGFRASEKMKVISLETGFHGRTLGALSATHSNVGYKEGFPSFPWLKLPVGDDKETLHKLHEYLETENVAACIIEPIQAEGGDVHMDFGLARDIHTALRDAQVPLIVDEVQTGLGATGKMWGHDHWDLPVPPDFVTVSKKAHQAGVFLFEEDIPEKHYQIFNTWLGNPWDHIKLDCTLDIIHEENLLDRVNKTGKILKSGLHEIEQQTPDSIFGSVSNVRGLGTFCAFDIDNNRTLVQELQMNGTIVGACGSQTVRIRPPLTVTPEEAKKFLQILERTLEQDLPCVF